jgi:hypothetical protein
MIITVKMLEDADACEMETFKKLFASQVEVTLENCQRAVEQGLALDWAASNLFSVPAWEAYEKATAPAWEAYEKTTAPAREAYEKATATAWEAYEKTTAPAREAYEKARSRAFYEASKIHDKGEEPQ